MEILLLYMFGHANYESKLCGVCFNAGKLKIMNSACLAM
jgi:hypothetical protein